MAVPPAKGLDEACAWLRKAALTPFPPVTKSEQDYGHGRNKTRTRAKLVGEFRTHTVEGKAAGGEARPRSTGQQEAHLAKAGFRVQLVDMQLEATGRAASPQSQGGEVKSSAVLLRTLASASAFAPSKLCDPAEHI